MIGFDEACARIAALPERAAVERIPLDQAAGRILAADIVASLDAPRADVSAMDGYAVREADLARLPARLRLAGESFPGQPDLPEVGERACVRIFTGAPVPPGADRGGIQEQVTRHGGVVRFERPPGPATPTRPRGGDFRAGEILLAAGTRLDARSIVAAAAADLSEIEVHCRPRVIVLATGDELAEPGTARASPVAIPESVSFGVAAMAAQWSGAPAGRYRLPDDSGVLEHAARAALDAADLIVVTGGASVGEKDHAKAMFGPAGLECIFTKVAIKPGKPAWLGRARGKLVLGLPGNPTSALVAARLFLAPLLLRMGGGDPSSALRWRESVLAEGLPAVRDRETFVRACWAGNRVMPLSDQDSGAQRALAAAELLVRRGIGAPARAAGETVDVLDF